MGYAIIWAEFSSMSLCARKANWMFPVVSVWYESIIWSSSDNLMRSNAGDGDTKTGGKTGGVLVVSKLI
jgi:hypothetical protein